MSETGSQQAVIAPLPTTEVPATEVASPEGDAPASAPAGDASSGGNGFMDILRRLGPSAWLAGFWTFAPGICATVLLFNMPAVGGWLQSLGTWGVAVYVGGFILLAGIGFLPTWTQAILAGFVFGVTVGVPAALLGFTGASVVAYFLARGVDHHRVRDEIARHPRAQIIFEALLGGSGLKRFGLVTLIRVPPNSPFALTNLALATGGVPLPTYVAATAIGLLPRTAAAVTLGSQVASLDEVETPLWIKIGGIAVTIAVFVLIAYIAQRALDKIQKRTGEATA